MKKPSKLVRDMMSKSQEGNYVGSQYNINYVDETKKKKKLQSYNKYV
jgi:hypothetical protein